jgi:hypothetical protein
MKASVMYIVTTWWMQWVEMQQQQQQQQQEEEEGDVDKGTLEAHLPYALIHHAYVELALDKQQHLQPSSSQPQDKDKDEGPILLCGGKDQVGVLSSRPYLVKAHRDENAEGVMWMPACLPAKLDLVLLALRLNDKEITCYFICMQVNRPLPFVDEETLGHATTGQAGGARAQPN